VGPGAGKTGGEAGKNEPCCAFQYPPRVS
jgi:hypothetical protein